MNDGSIREALHARLLEEHAGDPETVILHELGIEQGSARIDVAVVNGALTGYEIKSARDTLQRLPAQITAYSLVFDQVTLVLADRHAVAVDDLIPSWWGVVVAAEAGAQVSLSDERSAGSNPGPDPYSLAQLL